HVTGICAGVFRLYCALPGEALAQCRGGLSRGCRSGFQQRWMAGRGVAGMMNSTRESLLGLALVVAVHGGALGAMLWAPTPKSKELVLPTIQGVVIPAPPAETVQVPSAKEPPPPVERPPEPEKPKPKPKPKKVPPKPKPKPQPPPVEAPPSENAITQKEEVVEEQAAPAPQPQVSTPAVKDNDTLGAPIIPPRQDANPLN